jgi:hypothetical protein
MRKLFYSVSAAILSLSAYAAYTTNGPVGQITGSLSNQVPTPQYLTTTSSIVTDPKFFPSNGVLQAGVVGNGGALTNVNAASLGNLPANAYATTSSVVSITPNGTVYQVPVILDFTNQISVHVIGTTNTAVPQMGQYNLLTVSNSIITMEGQAGQNGNYQDYLFNGSNAYIGLTDNTRWWTNAGGAANFWAFYQSNGSTLIFSNATLFDPTGVYGNAGFKTNVFVIPKVKTYGGLNAAPVGSITNWITSLGSGFTNLWTRGHLLIPFAFTTSASGVPIAKVVINRAGWDSSQSLTFLFSVPSGASGNVTNTVDCGYVNPWAKVTVTDVSSGSGSSIAIDTNVSTGATLELP